MTTGALIWRAVPDSIRPEAVPELKTLANFLNSEIASDHNQFDIYSVLRKNINIQKDRVMFRKLGRAYLFHYENYMNGGSLRLNVTKDNYNGKYIYPGETVDEHGIGLKAGPRDVYVIATTKEYDSAMNALSEYINSPLMPRHIKSQLEEIKKIVDDNTNTIFGLLHKKLRESDNYFLLHDTPNTEYSFVIENEFARDVVLINDKVTKINEELHDILNAH
jgi:hypothetical protein